MPEAHWVGVLDDLERRLHSGDPSPWTPPSDLGPLPAELEPRARDLARAQRDAVARVEEELRRIGGDLSALRRAPAVAGAPASAYIDTVA